MMLLFGDGTLTGNRQKIGSCSLSKIQRCFDDSTSILKCTNKIRSFEIPVNFYLKAKYIILLGIQVYIVTRKKILIGVGIIILTLITGTVVGGFIYLSIDQYGPDQQAKDALKGNPKVRVINKQETILFIPMVANNHTFIFYPGGKVAPEAYAPLALGIADAGYKVIIPRFFYNLAVFNPNVADKWVNSSRFILGGHSLGGAMAADYTGTHNISGLILLAAYPSKNISRIITPVLSIYGSNDGIATPEKINRSRIMLPDTTVYREILGGNHAQFGSYGAQKGDGRGDISPQQQLNETLTFMLRFMSSIP